ncbi:MAG: DciA family protein [Elusimicrobiota bacterium]
MSLVQVKGDIERLLKKMKISNDLMALFKICENELGNVNKMVEIAGRKDTILYLRVKNQVYLQEMRLRRKELIKKINNNFGENLIKEIKIIY